MKIRSINQMLALGGLIMLATFGLVGGAGLYAAFGLSNELRAEHQTVNILQNHQEADMMHDAMRADVLAALAANDPGMGLNIADIKTDTAEHATKFMDAIKANQALASEASIRAALSDVAPSLQVYIDTATALVATAAVDRVKAQAGLPQFMETFRDLETRMGKATEVISAEQERQLNAGLALTQLTQLLTIAGLIVGVVFLAALVLIASQILVKPIARLTQVMGKLAAGDNQIAIPDTTRADEIGAIARSVEVFKRNAIEKIEREGEIERRNAVIAAERADVEAAKAQAAAEDQTAISALGAGLSALAAGDLTHRIEQPLSSKTEKLRTDFNLAIKQLEEAMTVIAANAAGIQTGASEISQAADDLSRRTEQQAATLEQTAAALDQITATVKKTAHGANQANSVVVGARSDAEKSGEVVKSAVGAMGQIEGSARQISQIIGVIDEIAFQTNLLALNAGVEAARAGDAGRGFAVVASEVRALAQRSAGAAKEIKNLILASTNQVETGVALVGQTGEALKRIVGQVSEISTLVSEITASAQEQATALSEVNTAVNQMDQVTQQNAAMVEESTAASHNLVQESTELNRLVGRFKVGSSQIVEVRTPARGRPVTQMKATSQRKTLPAPTEANWEEF